jgi:hypothetical protein
MRTPAMLSRARRFPALLTALLAAAVAASASRADAAEGVTVSDPATVVAGSAHEVTWTAAPGEAAFTLKYSLNGGRRFVVARDPGGRKLAKVAGTTAAWGVPHSLRKRPNCVLAVVSYDAAGRRMSVARSDESFAVKTVAITSPAEGDTLTAGTYRGVTWECGPTAKPVAIILVSCTTDGGTTWTEVAEMPGDAEGCGWSVPDVAQTSSLCRLRVELLSAKGAVLGTDVTEGEFTISRPPFQVVADAASGVGESRALLNGHVVNVEGVPMSVWFEYGPSEPFAYSTPRESYAAAGTIAVSAPVSGLPECTSFGFRLRAESAEGTFDSSSAAFRTLATPQVHAADLDAGGALQLADSWLYWIDVYGHDLRRAPAGGGTVTVLASVPFVGNSGSLVLDAENLYCCDYRSIWKVSRANWQLTTFASGRQGISAICLASGALCVRTDVGIEKLALDDGASTTLLRFASSLDYQIGYVADANSLYVADFTSVARVPLAGGAVTKLAVGYSYVNSLVLDAGQLYFSDDGGIHRMSTSGGVVTTITSESTDSLAVAGGTVYFTAGDASGLRSIRSVPVAGGAVSTLAVGQRQAYELVPAPDRLYWVCGGNHYDPPLGAILSVPLTCE